MTWGPLGDGRGALPSLSLSRPARGAGEHGASCRPILSPCRRRGSGGAGRARGVMASSIALRVGPRIAFQAFNNTPRQIFSLPPLNRMLHLAW